MTKLLYLAIPVLLLSSCGGNKTFRVNVDVPSIGTQEMTVVYLTDNGDRTVIRLAAIDGKFEFSGTGTDTTTIELFNAKKLLIASFPVINGMDVELRGKSDSLYIEDSDLRVTTAIADTTVSEWPKVGNIELVMRMDSVATFGPHGIWFFTSSTMERKPAVIDSIRKYAKADTIPVRDVYISGDISQWRLYTNRDSATWTRGLMPEAPLELNGIVLSTPCLVEVDTAGVVRRVQRLE